MYRFVNGSETVIDVSAAANSLDGLRTVLEQLGYRRASGRAVTQPAVALCRYHENPAEAACNCRTLGLIDADEAPERQKLTRFDGWAFLPVRPDELHLRIDQLLPWSRRTAPPADLSRLGLIGRDPVFVKALSRLERYAGAGVHVLICGETGVGKEKVARAIHYSGPSADGPFIPINCGAFPPDLFENELFGHRAGAFTGGTAASEGLIHQAEGGTLFLDEIDALSPASQVALLRFLQDRTYRRLGGGQMRQSNARIIAATNSDINRAVRDGRFRADLLFRLDVARIEIPPLKERPEDIAVLAGHFLQKLSSEIGGPGRSFSPALVDWMQQHDWPGNVRELENFVARELICAEGPVVGTLPEAPIDGTQPSFQQAKSVVIGRFERRYLTDVMQRAGGNVTEAARLSGKERRAFGRLLKKYDLSRNVFLDEGAPEGGER